MATITEKHIEAAAQLAAEMFAGEDKLIERSAEITVSSGLPKDDTGVIYKVAESLHEAIAAGLKAAKSGKI